MCPYHLLRVSTREDEEVQDDPEGRVLLVCPCVHIHALHVVFEQLRVAERVFRAHGPVHAPDAARRARE